MNISDARCDRWVDLPSQALFSTQVGPVVELIFYSPRVLTWFHGVSDHFYRELPSGHVQVTPGDMAWLRSMVQRYGAGIFSFCLFEFCVAKDPGDVSIF